MCKSFFFIVILNINIVKIIDAYVYDHTFNGSDPVFLIRIRSITVRIRIHMSGNPSCHDIHIKNRLTNVIGTV